MSELSPEKYSDIAKALYEFVQDDEPDYEKMSLAQIKEDLAKENIDVSSMVADVQQMIAKRNVQKKLDAAEAKRTALSRLSELKSHIPQNGIKEKLLSIINDLNKSEPKLAAAYFRKLQEVDEEDMAAILEDLLFLDQDSDDIE